MKWDDFRRSDNVEESSGGGGFGGGGMRLGGGAIVVVVVVSLLLGKNPLEMLAMLGDGGSPTVQTQTQAPTSPSGPPTVRDKQKDFVSAVLGDTEDVWGGIFQKLGSRYEPPKLTLFRGQVESACGFASAAMGPFYCPGDRRVYLDLAFFDECRALGAPATPPRHRANRASRAESNRPDDASGEQEQKHSGVRNALSVRQELQADCLAGGVTPPLHGARARGTWSRASRHNAVGDDRIQKQTRGRLAGIVHPRLVSAACGSGSNRIAVRRHPPV